MPPTARAAMVLDLDGTLVDSVYLHVRAWARALDDADIPVPSWRIHRRIGMAGLLLARVLLDEEGAQADDDLLAQLDDAHGRHYDELRPQARPLPAAAQLIGTLRALDVPWAIATSSAPSEQGDLLAQLGIVDDDTVVSDADAGLSKPDPELFRAAIDKLGVDPGDTVVVGDSPWDMLAAKRAGAMAVGVRTGGFSAGELHASGAVRVYNGPEQVRVHLPEFGLS